MNGGFMNAVQRRVLRFETVAEAIAEAEQLVRAEQAGRLRSAGTWSLGKTLGHLATWARYAHEGYPPALRPPWVVRVILRMMKGKIIREGLRPGVRLRGIPGGTTGLEEMSSQEGLDQFRAAMERLERERPPAENPVFGPMTHAQWIGLNLRHAELHLGFLDPGSDSGV